MFTHHNTAKLSIYGLVQGVGFRPYVQSVATKFNLCGTVKNVGGIVEIYINAKDKILDEFVQYLLCHTPIGSGILNFDKELVPYTEFDGFTITESDDCDVVPVIPADIGICGRCMAEFNDNNNRRHLHPFISCVSCGPRYSIIKKLPYDRENITMDIFKMCSECEEEYNRKNDRRCYAQTIACNQCGPKLYYTSSGNPMETAAKHLKQGKVIAVKDIGGFHFACVANNKNAVQKLRMLKNRDEKPFAVMFNNGDSVKEFANLNDTEMILLQSPQKPIVLVEKNKSKNLATGVCDNSNSIGAFLPCNSLQAFLTAECGPLVMTSGNISEQPIITQNNDMLKIHDESPYLDGVLYHDRDIVTPLDDSITKVIKGNIQLVRRGRGYTPLPIWLKRNTPSHIFASGGDLKASFCLMAENRAYMSQHFGDLENTECLKSYKSNIEHMEKLLNINPEHFACDSHPTYYSSQYTRDFSENAIEIQHHQAHIASVIAEHNLEGEVLGFAFDGTGYGTDGNIWGGEVFAYKNNCFDRIAHLKSVKMCGGDEISKNAKTVATCYMLDAGITPKYENTQLIKSALDGNISTVYSSSMGRLFDAVSSILDICHYNSYEGKCAVMLENCASTAAKPYHLDIPVVDGIWDTAELMRQICNASAPVPEIALGFHHSIADAVVKTAEKHNIKTVALSGGVFMNRILTELCIDKLQKKGYNVYINNQVPTNDGGVALGQAFILTGGF